MLIVFVVLVGLVALASPQVAGGMLAGAWVWPQMRKE